MVLTYTPKATLGQPMPSFSLPGTDGQTYSSDSFNQARVLVIIFTCNHCPYAVQAKPKLEILHQQYKDRAVQLVAINANESDNYPEDSFEKMKSVQYNLPFPYLRDESQEVAKAFGAVCTPDIFVYDKNRQLVYRGQLDDERPEHQPPFKPDDQEYNKDIKQAIESLIAGAKPKTEQKPSSGCSIKWK